MNRVCNTSGTGTSAIAPDYGNYGNHFDGELKSLTLSGKDGIGLQRQNC